MTEDLRHLGNLYHDFYVLGGEGRQAEGIFAPNQAAKAPVILGMLARVQPKGSAIELFAADGFYAMNAHRLGATEVAAVDRDPDQWHGPDIAEALGIPMDFHKMDVHDAETLGTFDIVINVGGLYHVDDPSDVLEMSYRMADEWLIVQSVVSLHPSWVDDPDWWVEPAPNWTWGCRYSKASFDAMIRSTGWDIVDSAFNELTGNVNPHDRGSAYYLIKKTEKR